MKTLAKIAVALTAVASCAAFAQSDGDADRARRDRNREEVLTKHQVDLDRMNSGMQMPAEHRTLRERDDTVTVPLCLRAEARRGVLGGQRRRGAGGRLCPAGRELERGEPAPRRRGRHRACRRQD